MNYKKLIEKIVEEGRVAVKKDYAGKDQKAIRQGSLAGFNACLDKDPHQLLQLLKKARKDAKGSFLNHDYGDKYWKIRGYTLKVEWVCNVVSAILFKEGKPVIVNPTARGVKMASKILNAE